MQTFKDIAEALISQMHYLRENSFPAQSQLASPSFSNLKLA